MLPPTIPYRMLVFTIPKCLRRIFMRERTLLGDFARTAYECTYRFFAEQFPGVDGKPYFVCAVQTFSDLGGPHPHLHSLCSLGIKDSDGIFHAAPEDLDFAPLEEMFRHAMLKMLREKNRITEQTQKRLLSWRHSGFSADSSVAVAPGDTAQLERIACYVLKPPISLARLTYKSGADSVVYRGKYNPSTKSNFQVLDPKEFLVQLLCHIPQPYEALIRYFGAAASTERRGQVLQDEPLLAEENKFVKKRRSSWARMIKKIYGVDPLTCPKCGSPLKIIATIHDPEVIEKILRHIGRWDPPRGPPLSASSGGATHRRVVEYDDFTDVPDHDGRDDDFYDGEDIQ